MQGAIKALMAQYETGQYETLRVTGKLLDNVGFSREIAPQEIQGHGPLTVELVPSLPQDDQAQWMMAEFARRPNAEGRPVVSDTFIKMLLTVPSVNTNLSPQSFSSMLL